MIAIFAGLMLKGIAPTIFGDGSTTRDYLFVEDAVAANLLTLEGGDREIYHVSSGQQISLNNLFCRLKEIIGSLAGCKAVAKMVPVHAEPRSGEIHRIALSPEKIQRDLGWKPQVSLQNGLERTISFLCEAYA